MNVGTSNRLLDQLPAEYRQTLIAKMEPVSLKLLYDVWDVNETPRFAHFVTSGVVSIVNYMSNGDGVEVGMTGREGLVEALHLLGSVNAVTKAFVQVEGEALRMPFAELQKQFMECEPLRVVVLAYVQTQAFAGAPLIACNRLHEVEARTARWLLMVADRMSGGVFELTQEFLAEMIGASRTTVTLTARKLQGAGLIKYTRGKVTILDRKALELVACECYGVVRALTFGAVEDRGRQLVAAE